MALIVVLIFTQEDDFNAAVHQIVSWTALHIFVVYEKVVYKKMQYSALLKCKAYLPLKIKLVPYERPWKVA